VMTFQRNMLPSSSKGSMAWTLPNDVASHYNKPESSALVDLMKIFLVFMIRDAVRN